MKTQSVTKKCFTTMIINTVLTHNFIHHKMVDKLQLTVNPV